MRELITVIAKALVDDPDQVQVTEIKSREISILELSVAKTDIGKVVGKRGRTANALRTILTAASAKVRRRTILEIME